MFHMDMISDLSNDLLLKILSSLTSKDVVATMLLSKRWKFLWTFVPKLHFDDSFKDYFDMEDDAPYMVFQRYVDKFLVSNRSPVLETLKFSLGCWYSRTDDMATWIIIAIARRVRELEIYRSFDADDYGEFELPQCLYTFDKLVVLKLHKWIVLHVPMEVCLSSLKSLHLVSLEYKTEQCHRKLLSGCPVLEELVLDKSRVNLRPCFYVEVPSLQRLSILDTNDDDNDYGIKVVINAPSLNYLNIEDTYDRGLLCLSDNMREMVEANVNVAYKFPQKLMGSLTSVKRLSLCLSTSMIQHRFVFYQLVHLQLCSCVKGWWELLTWMLKSSPKLQILKLDECKAHRFVVKRPNKGRWRQPSSVPECLLFHLNTFEWKYYNGRRGEKKMVAYILRNAEQLKTAKISAWRLGSEEGARKLNELASLHKASKSCQLLLDC